MFVSFRRMDVFYGVVKKSEFYFKQPETSDVSIIYINVRLMVK